MEAIIPVLLLLLAIALMSSALLLRRYTAARRELRVLSSTAKRMAGLGSDQGGPRPPGRREEDSGEALVLLQARLRELADDLSRERAAVAAILSTIGAAVLLLDSERRVTTLNRSAEKMFRVLSGAATGRPFITLTRDHEMDAMVQRCLETTQKQTGIVQLASTKQYLELTATPLRSGALVLVHDLTNVRRLEKTRQDFIANISHELRTPMASCKAIVETLQDGAIKDEDIAKDFLQRMHIEVDKLVQMVNELSELSRIESGDLTLKLELVDLTELLHRVADRLRAQADRAQLSMSLNIPRDLPKVTADENRIEQVLVNLVHNAIKFTPPNGSIVISAGVDGDNILVSVTDTGVGIPDDELTRIFERFYKVDKARSGGGTGLGLAIAKHIVQAHGGTIWAKSEGRKGSTFTFSLPIAV